VAAFALRMAPDLLDPAWIAPTARALAGTSLVAAGVLGWRRIRSGAAVPGAARRATLVVGAIHGLTGATAVLLALPVLASGSTGRAAWLAGFALGSTAAMACLTAVLGATASGLSRAGLHRAVALSSAGSVGLGLAWVLA
jgi:nickel/cobalt exporter